MQKNKNYHNRLKVSLHGMNSRAYKMMVSYLELSCKALAYVVIESESQAEIVDIDSAHSKSLLEKRLAQQPPKPIIVLSVQEVLSDDVIYIKKPIDIPHIVDAIKAVRKKIKKQNKLKNFQKLLQSSQHENLAKDNRLESATEEIAQAESTVTPPLIQNSHTKNKQKEVSSNLPKSVRKIKETLNNKTEEHARIDTEVTKSELLSEISTHESDLLQSAETVKHSVEPSVTTSAIKEVPKPAMTTSMGSYKVNALLDDFLSDEDTFDFFGEGNEIESLPSNNRRTVRYAIHSIKAKLARDSIISFNKVFIVWVLNVSSKGALVKMEVPVKLKGKVRLTIYFDPKHIFSVPARIVRTKNSSIYGLQFLSYQHELADYLVENDSSFSIV